MNRGICFAAALLALALMGKIEGAAPATAAVIGSTTPTAQLADQSSGVMLVKERSHSGNRGDRSYRNYGHSRPHFRSNRHRSGPFIYFDYGYDTYDYGPFGYDDEGSRCGYWSRRCARNWGYGNSDYYGCLRYYRCY